MIIVCYYYFSVGLENAKQVINDAVVLPRTKEKV